MSEDNVTTLKTGPRKLDPVITKELDEAIRRHPASVAKTSKPKGPPKGTPNPVYAKKREAQARYEAQEAKRSTRFQVDQNGTLYLLLALSAVMFAASAIIVANGTIAVAQFVGLAAPWMSWLFFGAVELAVLVFLLMYLIIGSRAEGSATGWFVAMIGASGVTLAANVFHVLSYWEFDWVEPRMWAGVVLGAFVPLSFILVSKGLSVVVFAKTLVIE